MQENYAVRPGQTLTITVQVDAAQSSPLTIDGVQEAVLEHDRENLIRELDVAVGTLKVREDQVTRLKDQVAELEKTLAESRELVEFKEKVADEIGQEADRLRGKVRELAQSLAARDNLLRDATAQVQLMSAALGRISGAVHTPALSDALRTTWQDKKAQAMRKAVREVRHLLGSPVPHQP